MTGNRKAIWAMLLCVSILLSCFPAPSPRLAGAETITTPIGDAAGQPSTEQKSLVIDGDGLTPSTPEEDADDPEETDNAQNEADDLPDDSQPLTGQEGLSTTEEKSDTPEQQTTNPGTVAAGGADGAARSVPLPNTVQVPVVDSKNESSSSEQPETDDLDFPLPGWGGADGLTLYSAPDTASAERSTKTQPYQDVRLTGYADDAHAWYTVIYGDGQWYARVADVSLLRINPPPQQTKSEGEESDQENKENQSNQSPSDTPTVEIVLVPPPIDPALQSDTRDTDTEDDGLENGHTEDDDSENDDAENDDAENDDAKNHDTEDDDTENNNIENDDTENDDTENDDTENDSSETPSDDIAPLTLSLKPTGDSLSPTNPQGGTDPLSGVTPGEEPSAPVSPVSALSSGEQEIHGPIQGWTGEFGLDLYSQPALDAPWHIVLAEQGMELELKGCTPENDEWFVVTYEGEDRYALVLAVLLERPVDTQPDSEEALLLSSSGTASSDPRENEDDAGNAAPARGWTGAFGLDLYSQPSLDAPWHAVLAEQGMELELKGYAPENDEWFIVAYEGEDRYALVLDVLLEPPTQEQLATPLMMMSTMSLEEEEPLPCNAVVITDGTSLYEAPDTASAAVFTDLAADTELWVYSVTEGAEGWYSLQYEGVDCYGRAEDIYYEETPAPMMMMAAAPMALAAATDTIAVTIVNLENLSQVLNRFTFSRSAVINGLQSPRQTIQAGLAKDVRINPDSQWTQLDTMGTDGLTLYSLTASREQMVSTTVNVTFKLSNGNAVGSSPAYTESVTGWAGSQVALNWDALLQKIPIGFRPVSTSVPTVTLRSGMPSRTAMNLTVVAQDSSATGQCYFNYQINYYTLNTSTQARTVVANELVRGVQGTYGQEYYALDHYPSRGSGVGVNAGGVQNAYWVWDTSVKLYLGQDSAIDIRVVPSTNTFTYTLQLVDGESGATVGSLVYPTGYSFGQMIRVPMNAIIPVLPEGYAFVSAQTKKMGDAFWFYGGSPSPVSFDVHRTYEKSITLIYYDFAAGREVSRINVTAKLKKGGTSGTDFEYPCGPDNVFMGVAEAYATAADRAESNYSFATPANYIITEEYRKVCLPLSADTAAIGVTPLALTVSPTTLTCGDSGGGFLPVQVTADAQISWTATCNANWLTLMLNGNAIGSAVTRAGSTTVQNGRSTFGVRPTANPTPGISRSATVTFTYGSNQRATVTVLQGTNTVFRVSPASLAYTAQGGSKSLTLTTGLNWTVQCSTADGGNWLTVCLPSRAGSTRINGAGSAALSVQCAANTSYSARSGSIVLTSQNSDRVTVNVTQAAKVAASGLSISPTSLSIDADGTSTQVKQISLTCPGFWSARTDFDWIRLGVFVANVESASISGNKNALVYISIAVNMSAETREGKVIFTETATGKQVTLTVTQTAPKPVSPSPVTKPSKHDGYKITYIAEKASNVPKQQWTDESSTIAWQIPIRDRYTFLGWSSDKNALTGDYAPGAPYTENKDITLYAIWDGGPDSEFQLGQYFYKQRWKAGGFALCVSPHELNSDDFIVVSDVDWIERGVYNTKNSQIVRASTESGRALRYESNLGFKNKAYAKGGFRLWFLENSTDSVRTGHITIIYANPKTGNETVKVFTVTQYPNTGAYKPPKDDDTLTTDPVYVELPNNKKTSMTISIASKDSTDVSWSFSSSCDWMKIQKRALPDIGKWELNLNIEQNSANTERTATITLTIDNSNKSRIITVFQPGIGESWLWPSIRNVSTKDYPDALGKVNGTYGSYLGNESVTHTGLDINGNNTPVVASRSGAVIKAKEGDVSILHDVNGDMYISSYIHVTNPQVSVGQWVTQGTIIATASDVGASANHLHFRIVKLTDDEFIDAKSNTYTEADKAKNYWQYVKNGKEGAEVSYSECTRSTYLIDNSPKDTPYMRRLIRPSIGHEERTYSQNGIEYSFNYPPRDANGKAIIDSNTDQP